MFSVQFLVISCFLSYTHSSVVDSLNCNDETVSQKLLLLFPKHYKTRLGLQQCRNLHFYGGHWGSDPRLQTYFYKTKCIINFDTTYKMVMIAAAATNVVMNDMQTAFGRTDGF